MKWNLSQGKALILILTIILGSCQGSVKYERSTGKTNEILVVTNNKGQWNSEVGKIVRDYFEQPLAGLPFPRPPAPPVRTRGWRASPLPPGSR